MKIVYSRRAVEELRATSAWLNARHPPGARRVRAAIVETIANLAVFPRSGQPQTVRGVRKARVRRYSYNVYYTVDAAAERIGIVGIQHASRAPEFRDA